MRSRPAAEMEQNKAISYDSSQLDLPVKPGDMAYWVDTDNGYIVDPEPLEIEGVVLMKDQRICALVEGDVLEIGSDIFLTQKDAMAWADMHRRPSIYELLDASGWHKDTPPKSGSVYVRYNDGVIQKVYYHDGSENDGCEGFYPYKQSYSLIRKKIDGWTDVSAASG